MSREILFKAKRKNWRELPKEGNAIDNTERLQEV